MASVEAAWSFQDNHDTCVLYHRASGAVIELNTIPGAFFHFIAKRAGRGALCEENATIRLNRPVRESTDKAVAKLDGRPTTAAGKMGVLGPDFRFSGWEATAACDQLALHRPKHGTRMALANIIGFVDHELVDLDEIQVCPLLVLHPEGFCLIGTSGQCIAVQEGRMIKIGIQGQIQQEFINTLLFDHVRLQPPLMLLFLRPWTCSILHQHGIEVTEFEQKFAGGDSALQKHVMHRSTHPAKFVLTMRVREEQRHCCPRFYSFEDTLFNSASKIQRRFQQHRFLAQARNELKVRASARKLQNAYRGHLARRGYQKELLSHQQRRIERRRKASAQTVQLAWRCRLARHEPRPLRSDSRPKDGATYCFYLGVSAVEAALLEQRGLKAQAGQIGTGVHLYADVSAARQGEDSTQVKDVVLEVAVDVGRVCDLDLDVHSHLRATQGQSPWEGAGYDSAWSQRKLCVLNAASVTVRQRVISRTQECRYRWLYLGEDEAALDSFAFSDYDSLLVESHFHAWDGGQGAGSQSVVVELRGPFKCQWKANLPAFMRRQQRSRTYRNLLDVGNKRVHRSMESCKRHACWGTKKAGPVLCRLHSVNASSDEDVLHAYNPPQKFTIDFAQMKKSVADQGPTTQKLLEQAAQQAKLQALKQGSRASLLPPVPPSSLSALKRVTVSGTVGNLQRKDLVAENASMRLAAAWRCGIARKQLAILRLERKIQAATWLQGACRIMLTVRAAQSVRDELRREHVLEVQSLQLQKALLRLLGKPFALLRISDLLRSTSVDMKKTKYYRSVMAKAISFCLEQNQDDLVKLLMDEGATLSIESINLTNVNIWLSSRDTPQHTLDNNNVDNDNAHEGNEGEAQESETAHTDQQMLENRESVRRVNAWLKGIVPDNTVDESTQLKRESVRLRIIIENQEAKIKEQEVKIKEIQFKCRRLEMVERELECKRAILNGMLCCKCEKTRLPVQYSKRPIGDVCSSCQAVVRTVNDEIQVIEGNGKFIARYGQEQDFYNGLDVFCGRPLPGGEAEILKAMAEECSGPVTGLDEIVTGNYGRVVTNMKTEWEFVFDPDPNRSYPGSELYALDPANPGKAIRVGQPMLDTNGKPVLDDKGNQKFWPGRRPVKLSMFLNHPVAQRARLLTPEVVGLRLYTGPAYLKLNGLLRMGSQEIALRREKGLNCYTYTISAINSGIRKLAQVTKAELEHRTLYRGTANMKMPTDILALDEKSVFVECAFSSATPRREVALQYSGTDCSSIFEIQTGAIDKGATLDWVSQYPSEGEHVILPLSNFQLMGMRQMTKSQVIHETQQMMLSQRNSLIERFKREQSNRFKDTVQAMVMRRGSMEAYDSRRKAAQNLQARIRSQASVSAMRGRDRLPVYQRPPGLPNISDTLADTDLRVEPEAVSSMEAQYILEKELEEKLRKERMVEEAARLETRLRLFFSQTCPEKAILGPEEVLAQTASTHVDSREQRVNAILRDRTKTKVQQELCLELDLTSTEAERDMRGKLLEIQERTQELEESCLHGWAKKYMCSEAQHEQLVNVYEVKLNINLNAMTIEQLSTVRKNCALDFAHTLLQESREYLSGLMSWDGTLGLKWVKLGASRPNSGSEVMNDALAQALVHRNEFTLAELESFGVADLSHQSFIRVDVSGESIFFKPADSIRAIERRMLEPWENKSVEWFNKDVSNFKDAIDQIFDNWTTVLAANVEDMQVVARQKQIEADQEGSAHKTETALKLLNRAIFIAERASGIQIGNAQQVLFDLTEEQSRSTGGGAARPGLQLSTSIFAQASRLMTSSLSSVSSAEDKDPNDPELILAEVLPLVVKGFRIRGENSNTPSISLLECQTLLRDIMQVYTPQLAAEPAMTPSLEVKDVIEVRANLDLVTFFHLELRRVDNDKTLANTASMVCYIIKSLTSYGIKSFQDFVSFMNVEDAHKLQLPTENKKDVLANLIRILNDTKKRQSKLQSKDAESFDNLQSQSAKQCMTEEQTNKLFASLTSDECVHDAFNRPVILDGLARLCFPTIRLDKIVHLIDCEVKDPTKVPILEKGVEAMGMLLAVAEGKDPICLPNDQGHFSVGQVPSVGIKPRFYCNRKLPRQSSTCTADNGGKQCQSCASLQLRAHQILLPLQEKHIIDIRENQMSFADCSEALIKVMKAYPLSTRIQAWGCTAISSLANWGNRGNSWDLVPAVTKVIEGYKWDEPVLLCAMRALNSLLSMSADKGLEAEEADAQSPADYPTQKLLLGEVTELMLVHRRNLDLQLLGLKCLCVMACENKKEIAAGWGLEAIIRALHEHCSLHSDTSLELQKEGCAFLQQLCCDGETCLRAVAVGCFTTILNTLEKYPAHMATPVMKLVLQICEIIANENSLTPQSIGIAGNIGRVLSIFDKTSFPDPQPYAHMCQMVHTLARAADDNVLRVLVEVGAKEAVTRVKIKFGNDSSVTEWAGKALSALNPPAERVTVVNNPPAERVTVVNNNSACCVVQ